MKFFYRYWLRILYGFAAFFLIGSLLMVFGYGNYAATTFNHNILVEFFIGGFMLLIPTIIGLKIGKKITKNLFYNDIERFIAKVKNERELRNLTEIGARNMVMEASSVFGKDVLEDPLLKRLPKSSDPILYEKKNCAVCNLKAQTTINKHCKNCKLDCFTWEQFIDTTTK